MTTTLDTLNTKEDFHIDENNIEGELCKAGHLLSLYGTLAAEVKLESAKRKESLERKMAEKALNIRETTRNAGLKITEGGIKERILTDTECQQAHNEYIEAEYQFQKTENLFRSMQRKVDCVRTLAYKQQTEIAKY